MQELNINTVTPVAYGCRGNLPSNIESFLITEDLGDMESLEDVCNKWPDSPPSLKSKIRLIEKIAWISHQMHSNGICHRDFYICHLLQDNADPTLVYVIDLHRALTKKNLARRWMVKDVGSLYFSARNIGLTRNDLMRFVMAYSGKSLRCALTEDAGFWSAVQKRARDTREKSEPSDVSS